MANLINNNFNFYKLKTYRGEYWDVILNKDINQSSINSYDTNLITYFDLSDKSYMTDNGFKSNDKYVWSDAYSIGYSLDNIGYTGFDNGLIYFKRDKICNKDFVDLYTNSKYEINSNDLALQLHFVTGCTNQYKYDYEVLDDSIKLNGGFLQGFFKTESKKYQVIPSNFNNGDVLSLEFILKPSEFENNNGKLKHLNDTYPNNKGIFWYIGTRAENKWIYLYDIKENELVYDDYKLNCFNICENEECNDCEFFGCNYVESELDISDLTYQTDNNEFTLDFYEDSLETDNKFLLFNRTIDGYDVNNWKDGETLKYVWLKNKFDKENNMFLLMNRTKNGYNVSSIDGIKENYDVKYNIYDDLCENALAFRITNDGEIGYRYLIKNCKKDNEYEIAEGYSKKNMVKQNEWNHIIVKVYFLNDNMQFKFYVNSNLIFISKFLPKLNLRELNEVYEKQETVPFNMSLGGGTQGLIETILPNYMLNPYRVYPLEKNFAGTFNGYIKTFKLYLNNLSYNEINDKFNYVNKQI